MIGYVISPRVRILSLLQHKPATMGQISLITGLVWRLHTRIDALEKAECVSWRGRHFFITAAGRALLTRLAKS